MSNDVDNQIAARRSVCDQTVTAASASPSSPTLRGLSQPCNRCMVAADDALSGIADGASGTILKGQVAGASTASKNTSLFDIPFEQRIATKNDLASYFSVDVRTIENWQRERCIPFIKIRGTVRFKMGDVIRHVEKHFRFEPNT